MHILQSHPIITVVCSKSILVGHIIAIESSRIIDPLLNDNPTIEGCDWNDGVQDWNRQLKCFTRDGKIYNADVSSQFIIFF